MRARPDGAALLGVRPMAERGAPRESALMPLLDPMMADADVGIRHILAETDVGIRHKMVETDVGIRQTIGV